ncbi:hypothetical protein ABHV46_01210 [Asaia sp. BMEF1]
MIKPESLGLMIVNCAKFLHSVDAKDHCRLILQLPRFEYGEVSNAHILSFNRVTDEHHVIDFALPSFVAIIPFESSILHGIK